LVGSTIEICGEDENAPVALTALLQVAGSNWLRMLCHDIHDLKATVSPKLDNMSSAPENVDQWVRLACEFLVQWRQLVKLFVSKKVQLQYAQWTMGTRTQRGNLEVAEVPCVQCACPQCNSVLFGACVPWRCI